jgi:hypothetical protein
MNSGRSDLMARIPTLTEVAEPGAERNAMGRDAPPLAGLASRQDTAQWVDDVMDALAPQVHAVLTSRLRDVVAPAVQEAVQAAVEDAVERCQGPLMEALMVRLRDVLEQEMARRKRDTGSVRP